MKTVFLAVHEVGMPKNYVRERKGILWGKVLKSIKGEELRCVNLIDRKKEEEGPRSLGRDVMLAGTVDIVAFEEGWENSGRLRTIMEAAGFFQRKIIEM